MTTMFDTTTNERLIVDWARLMSAHDLDGLLALFTDDAIYEDVALGSVNRGKTSIHTFAAHFVQVFPDVTVALSSRFVTPTHGGAEWVIRGTQSGDLPNIPAQGKRMELRGASIMEFAEGKIRRVSDYWDRTLFVEQLS
jgi:steroid delta-isomerase-like uncharacterized protein